MKRYFVLALMLMLSVGMVVGCGKKESNENDVKVKTAKLTIECISKNDTKEYKEGDKFTCYSYELTVSKIEDDKVTIKVNDYGLFEINDTDDFDASDKKYEFVVYKGKTLLLGLQIIDYIDIISIGYDVDPKDEMITEPTVEPKPEPEPEPIQPIACEYDYMEYIWNGCYDPFQLVRPGGCGYDWEENGVCYSYNCMQDGGTINYSCSEQYPIPGENECPPGYELHEGYCFMN